MFERTMKKADVLQKEIDSHRPLHLNALAQLRGYYRIGLTYASNVDKRAFFR